MTPQLLTVISLVLATAGGAFVLGFALLRKRRNGVLLALLTAVFSAGTEAQTQATDPDYTNVSDILNGSRTMLEVDDLVIAGTYLATPGAISGFQKTFTLTTSNSQLTPATTTTLGAAPSFPETKSFTGRMWNMPAATTVVLATGEGAVDPGSRSTASLTLPLLPYIGPYTTSSEFQGFYRLLTAFGGNPYPDATGGVMADFNHDGYSDLLLNFVDGSTFVVTAGDVNKFEAGVYPPFNFGPRSVLDSLVEMTAGDFNNDGKPEIAGIALGPSGGLVLVIYTVDPNTLAVSRANQVTLQKPGTGKMLALAIATGRFTVSDHDQLIVAYMPTSGTGPTLELIDFAPTSLTPQEKTTHSFGSSFKGGSGQIITKAGKFGLPDNPYDQVAFMYSARADARYLSILTIDPTLAWKEFPGGRNFDFSSQQCGIDMTVGNFDHRQPDPINQGQTQPDPNDQIALLYGSCSTGGVRKASIYTVDPHTLALTATSTAQLPSDLTNAMALSFTQSDTQGRSYVLAEPTKITIENLIQPTVIAAAPPMHIDFAKPEDDQTATVLNVSAIPTSYYTQYQTENSESNQSSHKGEVGTGWSVKETLTEKVQFSDPDPFDKSSASIEASFASSQANEDVHSSGTNNFSSHSFNVAAQTGFADQVWYTENYFNLWIYPVIGKTVCPASQPPDCPASAQVPLNMQFSAPDHLQPLSVGSGDLLQWYQPPWEYGNIFSYPANLKQLQLEIPVPLDKLSQDTRFSTDSVRETIQANWAGGSGTDTSTSTQRTYTEEGSLTVSGKVGTSFGSATTTLNVTSGGSQSFSNLDTSEDTIGASTGVQINKPGTFANPGFYNYAVVPYILGQEKPAQDINGNPAPPGLNTYGIIRTVFTADPTGNSAGTWWQRTYGQRPDVGLNHPLRWIVSPPESLADPLPRNCLSTGDGNMNCANLSNRTPTEPWDSEYHWMRGFFITDATNPGQGPQMEVANAGDQLSLSTRVYNYSLKAMDPGTGVHVRFYVQPWNVATGEAKGDSVLIEEKTLAPIPPWNTSDNTLNWVLVGTGTPLDTTPYAGEDLVFWVVVWMQDANGQLVPEIDGHGLTGIPGTLRSFADAAKLEECQNDGGCYSNNVGFYNAILHVLSKQLLGAEPPTTTRVEIEKIDLSPRSTGVKGVKGGRPVSVSATLQAGSVDVSAITVKFYDGDPQTGGTIFYTEQVPYIAANGTFRVSSLYRANSCGTHDLFLVVNQGMPDEVVRQAPALRVHCGESK